MSKLNVYDSDKKEVGTVDWPKSFGERANLGLIHQVVVAQQMNRRQGTAKCKGRHDVVGSTAKIYRQKGTGRARHHSRKANLFVGGGNAFGPRTRDYDVRLPQRIRRRGAEEVVNQRKREERLWILKEIEFEAPKTKMATEMFAKFGIENGLVVLHERKPFVEKSIRNLAKFKVCRVDSLSVVDVLRYDHLVMTEGAYQKFIEGVK